MMNVTTADYIVELIASFRIVVNIQDKGNVAKIRKKI